MSARATVIALLAAAVSLFGQESGSESVKGFTLYERLMGTASTLGSVTRFDSTAGYNFNRYFGVDAGIPVYFVRPSSSTTAATGTRAGNGMGDFYMDLRVTVANPAVNYFTVLNVTAPTGDRNRGFSTGSATVDWTNHFERSFGRLTPFANLGLANTVSDTMFFVRPFISLGFVAHVEGGANYRLSKYLYAGASAYEIAPSGQQTIVSRVVTTSSASSNSKGRGGVFETSSVVTGPADIAKDHGFILRGTVPISPYFEFDAGYTRSTAYDLNAVFFGVGINVASIIRKSAHI